MSKQDIEKRLGFAAQGVKAEFVADRMTTAGALRRAMRAKGVISAGDLEWYGILASDPDSAPYLYKAGALERMEDDRHQPNIFFPAPKKKSSRPGAKAKFEYLQSDYMKLMRYHQMAMNGDRLAFKTSEAEKACDLALNNKPYRPNPKAKSSHDLAEELKDALGEAY